MCRVRNRNVGKVRKKQNTKARAAVNTAAKGGVLSAKKPKMTASESGEVVKFDEADMPQLDVWLEDETVWLAQAQMAELFGCAIANINMHLNHIYADEELEEAATIKDFLIVRFEGRRRVAHDRRRTFHRYDTLYAHARAAGRTRADWVPCMTTIFTNLKV